MPTFAQAVARGTNSFEPLRLAAALLVLASHAYVLTGHPDSEPVAKAFSNLVDGGALAVAIFFVVSGFLVARSAQRRPPAAYARARALRLYPAFAVAVVLQTLILGPALSALPAATYLATPATWSALARSLLFSPPATLPGVFAQNPIPDINGSLWTLRIEALCYAGLLLLARTGFLRPARIPVPLAAAWLLLAATIAARNGLAPPVLATLRVTSIVDCLLHFMMGAALWTYAAHIPRTAALAGAGAAMLLAAAATPAGPVILHLVLPYLTISLALVPRRRETAGMGAAGAARPAPDISYGIYLYAFPIQQAAIALAGPLSPLQLVVLSLPPTILLAAASCLLIERPALRLKQ